MKLDEILVQRAAKGCSQSFDTLVKKYQTGILSLCYETVGSFAEAQDLTQETFVRAFERIDQLRESKRFVWWLRRIALNLCYSATRSQVRTESVELFSHDSPPVSLRSQARQLEALEDVEKRRTVIDLLDILSDKTRITARLFYIDGLSYQEISDLLNITVTTVESRLHKARQKLKIEFRDGYSDSKRRGVLQRLTDIAGGDRKMDEVRIEIGCDLIAHAKDESPEGFLAQIRELRNDLAKAHRLGLPPVRIIDKTGLRQRAFDILIREVRCKSGELSTEDSHIKVIEELRESILEQRNLFD